MRRGLTALLVLGLLLPSIVFAEDLANVDPAKNLNKQGFIGFVPDRFIVVLKDDVVVDHGRDARAPLALSTMPGFDELALKYDIDQLRPQFPGSDRKGASALAHHYKVSLDAADLDAAMAEYATLPNVERVEKIGIHTMYATPNDSYFDPYQWYHNQTNDDDIDSPEAWDIQTGNSSIILAILDSGTRYYHRDLGGANASPTNVGAARGNMWINDAELNGSNGVDDDGNGYTDDWIGYDFISSTSNCWSGEDCNTQDNDPRDFNGHGTHTAGIVGMLTNNSYGMAGVAGGWGNGSEQEYGNGVKVMACRMGFSYNYGGQEYGVVYMDAAAEAFYYAADNGAKVASCSWGSSNSGGIAAAADYFINSGGLIFVAAGNDGSQTADYLNGRGDIVSVAATDEDDAAASFTTYGTWVDISAPGVGIYSTYHDHSDASVDYWASMDGTSMACPMAAAVASMIWSQNPSWTNSQVEAQLYASADDIESELSSTYRGKMGAGRVNLYAAVNTGTPDPPVADFSGTPTSGTEPLTVSFSDLSTGSITSWAWTFGDGGTSTNQNPSYEYTSAGTYTVTLTVTGPGGSDGETKNGYITVNPCVSPTAGFTGSPTSGDYPLNVSFTNSSSGATSYSWNFGDGGSSTATNPSHTYTAAGTYTVTLTATNACGSDQDVKTDYITVTTPPCDPPVADFSGSPTSGDYNLNVSFNDLSTFSPTSWSWTFGDGGTSTSQNPSHTYTAAGTYTVSLTATNACGSDGETKTGYITVTEPSSDYASLPYSTGFETGGFDAYWFTQSSNTNGAIVITSSYTPRGSYHLAMDAITNGTYVQNEAWLRLDLAGKSDVDLTFWWKEHSDETHSQDGVFLSDNGGTDFVKVRDLTGTSTYTQIAMDIDALAASNGLSLTNTFVIKFQQYDNYGLTTDGMTFDDINVVSNDAPPVAAFVGSPTSGSYPLAVAFTDQSTGNPTSWAWTFGDGGTSTAQNPSHSYTAAGTYTVTLTATNAFGSDGETKTDYITVTAPPPPTADFSATPTAGVLPLLVAFSDASTGSPTSWAWTFGDGGTSTEQNPSYTYNAVGTYTVTLTATNAYGSDGETKTDYITVSEGGGWTVITYDDFESGFGNYTDGGGDCALYTGGTYSYQGSNSARIRDNSGVASSFYHTSGYNVTGYQTLEVDFWFMAVSMDNTNEDFWLQYYDGSAWQTVETWARTTDFDNGVFYHEVVTISAGSYSFPSNAQLRFMCDASGNRDYVYIDEVEFRGSATGSSSSRTIEVLAGTVVLLPDEISLSQNHPNPFNPTTEVAFSLDQASMIKLEVYNVVGQQVAVLAEGMYPAGDHEVSWDAVEHSSGVYFYRLTADDFVETKKMVLLK